MVREALKLTKTSMRTELVRTTSVFPATVAGNSGFDSYVRDSSLLESEAAAHRKRTTSA